MFYRPGALPVAQPTVSIALMEKKTYNRNTKLHLRLRNCCYNVVLGTLYHIIILSLSFVVFSI